MSDSPEAAPTVGRAKTIAIITLASRFLGLARDMALAAWLGNGVLQDRFIYGFAVPNIFRRLFGEGALSAAFVPTLTRQIAQHGPDEGRRLYVAIATLLAVILSALVLVLELVLALVLIFGPESSGFRLGISLTMVMLPFMPLICLTALMASCLNVLGRFAWPAAMPVLMNLVIMAAIAILSADLWLFGLPSPDFGTMVTRVTWLGVAVVLSGLAQVVALGWQLHHCGYRWHWSWRPRDEAVKAMLTLMAPTMVGLGVLQIEPLLDGQIIFWLSSDGVTHHVNLFGQAVDCPLEAGTQSSVAQAQRLYQFPLGVLAISLATAVFPTLARFAAESKYTQMKAEVHRSIRLAVFEGLPAGLGLILLAEPITRLLFEHGNFTPRDTALTAWVLTFYAAGLWAYCAQHMLLRGFYAMHDARTPLKVSVWCVAINLSMNLLLVWTPLAAGTFGLTTALTAMGSVVVLALLLERRIDQAAGERVSAGALAELVAGLGRTAISTAVMSASVWLVWVLARPLWVALLDGPAAAAAGDGFFDHWWTSHTAAKDASVAGSGARLTVLTRLLDVLVPTTVGSMAFVLAAWAMAQPELRWIVSRKDRQTS